MSQTWFPTSIPNFKFHDLLRLLSVSEWFPHNHTKPILTHLNTDDSKPVFKYCSPHFVYVISFVSRTALSTFTTTTLVQTIFIS